MRVVAISTHGNVPAHLPKKEQEYVMEMFEAGLESFHLRKPVSSIEELREWLNHIDPKYHDRIIIHSFHDLALDFSLKGIHLTTRQRVKCIQSERQVQYLLSRKKDLQLSTSFHELDEIRTASKRYAYVFFSPVYDSISKPHYRARFTDQEMTQANLVSNHNVLALGGITAEKIDSVREMGFSGVALLGALWKSNDPVQSFIEVQKRCQDVSQVVSQ